LQPLGIAFTAAVAVIVEAVRLTGDLPGVAAAARFYKAKPKTVTPKCVSDIVAELLALKKSCGGAAQYLDDLAFRLEKFADKFQRNIGSVTTTDVQAWLDGLKSGSQSYANNRRVVHLVFELAIARGCAQDNPAAKVERVKIRNGAVKSFTPAEAAKLLGAAPADFLPCLALGLLAGLRSAEFARLTWRDIELKAGHLVVSADAAKTAIRRVVPVCDALAAWLAPYAGSRAACGRMAALPFISGKEPRQRPLA
jgi:site-specific recombinase XerD